MGDKITRLVYLHPRGGKINQPGYVAPGGEDIQGWGRIFRATCPWLACPPGATCSGGKINWDTGTIPKCNTKCEFLLCTGQFRNMYIFTLCSDDYSKNRGLFPYSIVSRRNAFTVALHVAIENKKSCAESMSTAGKWKTDFSARTLVNLRQFSMRTFFARSH